LKQALEVSADIKLAGTRQPFYHNAVKKIDSRALWAGGIFAAALAVRLLYFFQIKANFPGWDSPTIDPLYHDLWARQIASGDIWGSGPFFRAPFYAYFLGLIYAIFGPSLAAAKIIQHVIGAATCSVIFLFADRVFGRKTAIAAGLVSTLNWVFIYHEDELLLDPLLALFSVAILWQLMSGAEKPTAWRFFIAGLWLGLASITRPNYLAILPVILIWLLLLWKRDYRKIAKCSIAVVLGMILLILPVTLRNIIVGKDAVLIASQGGVNFYIGNNAHADGATAALPEFGSTWQYSDAEFLAKAAHGKIGKEMKQSEVSSFFYGKGLDYIKRQPLQWLGSMIKKLDYFWNGFEISNNQNLYFYRRFASITKILPPLFYVISPLSLMGIALLFKYPRKYWIVAFFVIAYMLTVIAFFVNSRFRLPVLPILIISASVALWKVIGFIKERNALKSAIFAGTLATLIALTSIDFFGISHESYAMSHFSLGNVYLKKGMQDKALEEYSTAISMAPCVPKAHLNRGVIYFSRNDYLRAEREFQLELESCHVSAEAHNNLSVLKRLNGDFSGALDEAKLAVAEKFNYPEAYLNEILANRQLGEDSAAIETAKKLILYFPDYLAGHYMCGVILSERGEIDKARREFQIVSEAKPANIVERYDLSTIYASQAGYGLNPERLSGLANYELGLLEVKSDNIERALLYFKRAATAMPDHADSWINLALAYDHQNMYKEALDAFKAGIDLNPMNAIAYYDCGLTFGKLGKFPEAAIFFRQALDLDSTLTQAREKLKLVETLSGNSGQK
jgi:tetratricopeptide (TPR) repeat protein